MIIIFLTFVKFVSVRRTKEILRIDSEKKTTFLKSQHELTSKFSLINQMKINLFGVWKFSTNLFLLNWKKIERIQKLKLTDECEKDHRTGYLNFDTQLCF